jgi:hypothetical protein
VPPEDSEQRLHQAITGWARIYRARSPGWFYWRRFGLPLLLLVVALPIGATLSPAHPADYWVRAGVIYIVVALAVGLSGSLATGAVTALGGAVILLGTYVVAQTDAVGYLSFHVGALLIISALFAIARRYRRRD